MSVFLHVHRIDVFTPNCSNYHMSTRIFVWCCACMLHSISNVILCFLFVSAVAKYTFHMQIWWWASMIFHYNRYTFSTKLAGVCYKTLRYVSEPTGIGFSNQRKTTKLWLITCLCSSCEPQDGSGGNASKTSKASNYNTIAVQHIKK